MATDHNDSTRTLVAVSFNMHGYNQGFPTAEELVKNFKPDVFMFQEHWLTPANLCLFQKQFTDYFAFGSSAMSSSVASGMLHGRPFGGVMTLISNNLRKYTETIYSDERFVIVKIGRHLFVNVYFPCSGTVDRLVVYENVLSDIAEWYDRYRDCECVIAGDFNCDIDGSDAVSLSVQKFIRDGSLDAVMSYIFCQRQPTYVSEALNQASCIDYVLTSATCDVKKFVIVDPNINFLDHLPIMCEVVVSTCSVNVSNSVENDRPKNIQYQLRWDKANQAGYYHYTHLSPLITVVDDALQACTVDTMSDAFIDCIEQVYGTIVST